MIKDQTYSYTGTNKLTLTASLLLQLCELKQSQMDSMIALCKEQYKAELEVNMKYHPLLFEALRQAMEQHQAGQLKRLDDVHDKEVGELKKRLDAVSREEMKALAKKHKDKSELSRWGFVFGISFIY